MRYLLDTNILSEPIKATPNTWVMESLQNHHHEVATASIVWHELWFGCFRLPLSKKRQRIERYLQDILLPYIPILAYSQAAAEWHAQERARLTTLGLTPAFADGQIAAIAQVNELILVTANVSDYENFDGLLVENWTKPNLSFVERLNPSP